MNSRFYRPVENRYSQAANPERTFRTSRPYRNVCNEKQRKEEPQSTEFEASRDDPFQICVDTNVPVSSAATSYSSNEPSNFAHRREGLFPVQINLQAKLCLPPDQFLGQGYCNQPRATGSFNINEAAPYRQSSLHTFQPSTWSDTRSHVPHHTLPRLFHPQPEISNKKFAEHRDSELSRNRSFSTPIGIKSRPFTYIYTVVHRRNPKFQYDFRKLPAFSILKEHNQASWRSSSKTVTFADGINPQPFLRNRRHSDLSSSVLQDINGAGGTVQFGDASDAYRSTKFEKGRATDEHLFNIPAGRNALRQLRIQIWMDDSGKANQFGATDRLSSSRWHQLDGYSYQKAHSRRRGKFHGRWPARRPFKYFHS